jgi:hypothetical protein
MRRLGSLSPCRLFFVAALGTLLLTFAGCAHPQVRSQAAEDEAQQDKDLDVRTIGELTEVGNVQPIAVSGVGVVTGLDGTGGSPPGFFRTMLEDQLRKHRPLLDELLRRQRLKNVSELLDSPDNALVLIAGMITAGARKGDKIDLEITLPAQSKATSLRGGYLEDCVMYSYNTARNAGLAVNPEFAKPDQLLKGHILARARGPLVVGLGDGDENARVRRGHVWEGGISLIDRPFYLVLNNDRKFKAALANAVAERINGMFQETSRERQLHRLRDLESMTSQINAKFPTPAVDKGEMATAASKEVVNIKVPYEYRLNPERYLLVVRLMPLRETAEVQGRYRRRLEQMLLDPNKTVRAALRLEALGKESIPTLKKGLESDNTLVRFCSAEALAYLGSPSSGEALALLAEQYEPLRAACLTALASLDEAVCHVKLHELTAAPVPELRYGAFNALRLLGDRELQAQGVLVNDSFWVYRVVPKAPPLIHLTSLRRAEVVLFGDEPQLVPPVKILAGPEFTVTAERGDSRCVVSRFMMQSGKICRQPCGLRLEDVIPTMANMGAQYPDVVDLLQKADRWKCLNCAVKVDALPPPSSVLALARGARDPNFLKDEPDKADARADRVAGAQ